MKEFILSEGVKVDRPGFYMITFPEGHFYIGGSEKVYSRVKAHIRAFKHTGSMFYGCKALVQMKDFEGIATVELIGEYEADRKFYGWRVGLLRMEYDHIEKHVSNPLLLNDPRNTGSSQGLTVHIKKRVHQKVKAIAEERGLRLSEYVESLLRQAIRDHELSTSSDSTTSLPTVLAANVPI